MSFLRKKVDGGGFFEYGGGMKKLTFEDGHLVLRNQDGTLFWSSHVVDIKDSYVGKQDGGGYKEVWIDGGKLVEKNLFQKEDKILDLQ